MTVQTEKEFYIETKHYVYVDYTIRARDKEHALEQFENGSYDDIDTDQEKMHPGSPYCHPRTLLWFYCERSTLHSSQYKVVNYPKLSDV